MSATGRTPNYNLAVYKDYDITSYLQDFNGNMEAIDTAMKAISDAVTGGGGAIGSATDFQRYFPSLSTIVRNNQTGSTTPLITIPNVVPATYNFTGFVEADTSNIPDDAYATITINLDGNPTQYSMKLYTDPNTKQYTFAAPMLIAQKGSITLEATLQTATDSSVTFTQAALTLQKLSV